MCDYHKEKFRMRKYRPRAEHFVDGNRDDTENIILVIAGAAIHGVGDGRVAQ